MPTRNASEWIAAGADVYSESLYDGTPGLEPSPLADALAKLLEDHGGKAVLEALRTATSEAAVHLESLREEGDPAFESDVAPGTLEALETVRASLTSAIEAL